MYLQSLEVKLPTSPLGHLCRRGRAFRRSGAINTSEDNPFAGPKTPVPGKVSVQMPTENWLCRKLSKLKLTLVAGYPFCTSEAGGLSKDVFLRPAKSQSKWYGLFSDHKVDPQPSHLRALMYQSSTTVTAGLPDIPACLLPHKHRNVFPRKHCENGRISQRGFSHM